MSDPPHVAITGASSGIGRALALLYAARGAHLSITGRDEERLSAVARACANAASVTATRLDVTDGPAAAAWIAARDAERPVDILIANAGIGGAAAMSVPGEETAETARRIIATNLLGAVHCAAPLIPAMQARGRGRIVLIGSLAGLTGLPDAPAYSASKAGLHAYGEALRRCLGPSGVTVTLVLPGFVETPMSASLPNARPFLWTAERAALRIARAADRGEAVAAFPLPLVWLLGLRHVLPAAWLDPALRALSARARRGA